MSELVFLFSADSDIQSAFQPGRGEVFMRHLDVPLRYLREFPAMAPFFHEPYRRLLMSGFPYGIFYSIEGRRVIVAAVIDLRQNPEMIRKRLSS